jgi:citrate lyase beta subunit
MEQLSHPYRSVLYMPGSNPRALEKAKTLAADALILDLEDAVAPDEKPRARELVCEAVRGGRLRAAQADRADQRARDRVGRAGPRGRGGRGTRTRS